jgi:hypothetical protein
VVALLAADERRRRRMCLCFEGLLAKTSEAIVSANKCASVWSAGGGGGRRGQQVGLDIVATLSPGFSRVLGCEEVCRAHQAGAERRRRRALQAQVIGGHGAQAGGGAE